VKNRKRKKILRELAVAGFGRPATVRRTTKRYKEKQKIKEQERQRIERQLGAWLASAVR
jgi:hypothetical protein